MSCFDDKRCTHSLKLLLWAELEARDWLAELVPLAALVVLAVLVVLVEMVELVE